MFDCEKFRKFREHSGLSQEALANLIGVDWHTVWSWENNKNLPRLDNLLSACRILNCKVSDVFIFD